MRERGEIDQQAEQGILTIIDYEYNPLKIEKMDDSQHLILAYDKEPFHHGSRNVLFLDGSVILLEEKEFQTLLENQRKTKEQKSNSAIDEERNQILPLDSF